MKKIVFVTTLLAALLFQSCNTFLNKSEPMPIKFMTHREALDTLREKFILANNLTDSSAQGPKLPQGKGMSYVLLGPDSTKEVLTKIEFTRLLNSDLSEGQYSNIYNGFFGEDRYRIEFVLRDAVPDSVNPSVISLQGKTRYKKNVLPFTGSIVIDSVYEFRDSLVMSYWEEYARGEIRSYYLKGHFLFSEDSGQWGGGRYQGDFFMDVRINSKDGEQDYWYYSYAEAVEDVLASDTTNTKQYEPEDRSGTRGAGFLFDGNWTSYKNSTIKPLLLAHDIFMFGNDILENFSYGEREIEINPKYKVLGWENYWENEEWYNNENAKVMMITW